MAFGGPVSIETHMCFSSTMGLLNARHQHFECNVSLNLMYDLCRSIGCVGSAISIRSTAVGPHEVLRRLSITPIRWDNDELCTSNHCMFDSLIYRCFMWEYRCYSAGFTLSQYWHLYNMKGYYFSPRGKYFHFMFVVYIVSRRTLGVILWTNSELIFEHAIRPPVRYLELSFKVSCLLFCLSKFRRFEMLSATFLSTFSIFLIN